MKIAAVSTTGLAIPDGSSTAPRRRARGYMELVIAAKARVTASACVTSARNAGRRGLHFCTIVTCRIDWRCPRR